MRVFVAAFLSGTLFGVGLAISGMTQPAKVTGFLDFTGAWDPSLAFVMGGALFVFAPTYFLVRNRRERPLLTSHFDLPTKTRITWQLVLGASIFGLGWGLAGFCPGTAITSAPTGDMRVFGVVGGIAVGILLTRALQSAVVSDRQAIPQADF